MLKVVPIFGVLLALAACGKQKPYRAAEVAPPPMFPARTVVEKSKPQHVKRRDLGDEVDEVMGLDRHKDAERVR